MKPIWEFLSERFWKEPSVYTLIWIRMEFEWDAAQRSKILQQDVFLCIIATLQQRECLFLPWSSMLARQAEVVEVHVPSHASIPEAVWCSVSSSSVSARWSSSFVMGWFFCKFLPFAYMYYILARTMSKPSYMTSKPLKSEFRNWRAFQLKRFSIEASDDRSYSGIATRLSSVHKGTAVIWVWLKRTEGS